MAGSQKITLWGPQRTPLGILGVKILTCWVRTYFGCPQYRSQFACNWNV